MSEKAMIIEDQKIVYEGPFSVRDLYKTIRELLVEKGYVFFERKIHEAVGSKGKTIEGTFEPFKKFNDYAKGIIRLNLTITDCKEIELKKDGRTVKLNTGRVHIAIDGILETDYEHRWEKHPILYVVRTLFEKYVFVPHISGFTAQINDDVAHLRDNIKAFLNLYKM
jgi:hypothetical protein